MWNKLLLYIGPNVLGVEKSRHITALRIIFIVIYVVPGSYIGAKVHIGGSIPHLCLLVILQYINISDAFHYGLGPPICH